MYSSQSSDNTSEDGGDVTPTELRPEVLIEVEKEDIVEEVEKREKSPASDHKLSAAAGRAAEDSGEFYFRFLFLNNLGNRGE